MHLGLGAGVRAFAGRERGHLVAEFPLRGRRVLGRVWPQLGVTFRGHGLRPGLSPDQVVCWFVQCWQLATETVRGTRSPTVNLC